MNLWHSFTATSCSSCDTELCSCSCRDWLLLSTSMHFVFQTFLSEVKLWCWFSYSLIFCWKVCTAKSENQKQLYGWKFLLFPFNVKKEERKTRKKIPPIINVRILPIHIYSIRHKLSKNLWHVNMSRFQLFNNTLNILIAPCTFLLVLYGSLLVMLLLPL